MERAALARRAVHPHLAAHHLDQVPGDGQAEPGAAVAARRRHVGLLERREQPLDLVGGDADAGVADGEVRAPRVDRLARHRDLDADLAALGELDAVAEQVQEHLAQAQRVADDALRRARLDPVDQLEPLLVRPDRQRPGGVGDDFGEIELDGFELQLADFELRDVEDVVDHAEQAVGARAQRRQVLALQRRQRRVGRAAPPSRTRRSSASGSRGSCWRGTRSWRGCRPRRRGGHRRAAGRSGSPIGR